MNALYVYLIFIYLFGIGCIVEDLSSNEYHLKFTDKLLLTLVFIFAPISMPILLGCGCTMLFRKRRGGQNG